MKKIKQLPLTQKMKGQILQDLFGPDLDSFSAVTQNDKVYRFLRIRILPRMCKTSKTIKSITNLLHAGLISPDEMERLFQRLDEKVDGKLNLTYVIEDRKRS